MECTIMIAIWIAAGSCFTYTIASQIDDMSIAKEMSFIYNKGTTNSNHFYKFNTQRNHSVYKEYYVQNTRIKDTVVYERGTIFRGDTIVDAKLVTTYVEQEDNKGVYELDTLSIYNMATIDNPSYIASQKNYMLGKILFALAILATLCVFGMRIKNKKRYFALVLTIMITLWLLTCLYFIKELYFNSDDSSHSQLVVYEKIEGDSTTQDTIINTFDESIESNKVE